MNIAKEDGVTYYGGGTMFLTPGQGTYRLYDLSCKPTSGNITANQWKTQTISFMLPSSAKTDPVKTFYFAGAATSDKKWHYATTVEGECVKDAVVEDFEIPAGTGFFCTFSRAVTVVCAGEVLAKSGVATSIQKPSTDTTYFFTANPLPRAVALSEISLSAASGNITANQWKTQTIAFMLPTSAKTDPVKTYYFAGAATGDKKWHYATTVDGECVKDAVVENADEIMIPAGKGFFCTFSRAVQINFPTINY